MGRNRALFKNTIIILLGKVCTQFISYLLLPIYTTVLSAEEYGTLDLLITYTILIAPIITLQIEAAVFRFLIDVRDDFSGISDIITNSITYIGCVMAVFLFGYIIFNCFIDFKYAVPFAVCVITNALISLFLQLARGVGNNITYAIGSIISGVFTIVFNIIFIVIFPFGVIGMLSATAIAQILAVIYIAVKIKVFQYFDFKRLNLTSIKEMLKYSLPLIPNSLSWWIISVSDRTLVSLFLGVDLNGILAVATKLAAIEVNVFAVFNISWTESVAVHINDEDGAEYISNITNHCFKLFGAGGMVLIMICAVFFENLVGSNFQGAYNLIPLLVIGGVFNILQTLYGIIYIGLKDTKQLSKSSIMAALINISIDLLLIKTIGIYAAVISTICSMLFLFAYRYLNVNKIINIKLDSNSSSVLGFMYLVAYIVYIINRPCLNAAGLGIAVLFCFFWNKNMIIRTVKTLKMKIHHSKS